MDPRLSGLEGILGLKTADMDVIRTGGPAVTDDVMGELVVSTRVLGSKEIMLLNHTGRKRRHDGEEAIDLEIVRHAVVRSGSLTRRSQHATITR